MNVFTADLKDDKKKLIEDAVAELKNAGGDGPAKAAASPKKEPEKPKKVEKPKVEAKKKPAAKKPAKKAVKKAEPTDDGPPKLGSPLFFIFW